MTTPSRQCGECTLCCKVFTIGALAKPMGQWCTHCDIGSGCRIYDSRPEVCRTFNCSWLVSAGMAEEWKPSLCGMVIHTDPAARKVLVRVDHEQPDAWQCEPYHAQLRRWANDWSKANTAILVLVGDVTWVVLPDRDVCFGEMAANEIAGAEWVQTPAGPRYEAFKRQRQTIG